jgi:hypothetical protein
MEAVGFSEKLLSIYQTTLRHFSQAHDTNTALKIGKAFPVTDPEARVRFPALPEKN